MGETVPGIGRKRSKRIDLKFICKLMPELSVCIEIDEAGHSTKTNNDTVKNAYSRLDKIALVRIDATNKDLLDYVHGKSQ